MVVLTKKVKASTMVETIVAMVIIMISMGIGLTLFSNFSRDVNDELRIEAEIKVNSLAVETKLKKTFTDIEIESENLRIQRSILGYDKETRVRELLIEAYSIAGKKACEYKELVIIN
jgi:competence protein ComGF